MENNKPTIITYNGVKQSGCTTAAFNRAKELTEQGNTVLVITDGTRLTPKVTNDIEWINIDSLKHIIGRKFDYLIFDKCYDNGLIDDSSINERNYIGHADIILRFDGDKDKISDYIRDIVYEEVQERLEREYTKIDDKITAIFSEEVIDFKEIEKLKDIQKYLKIIYNK